MKNKMSNFSYIMLGMGFNFMLNMNSFKETSETEV